MKALSLVVAMLAATPPALPDDLSVDSAEWNGVSRFVGALLAAGIVAKTPASLDLSTVAPRSGIGLIGSAAPSDPGALHRFVQQGGRLLVADETAAIDALCERFGVRRVDPPSGPRAVHFGGHPALFLIDSPETGPFDGVRYLVANHPAAFEATDLLEPALRFAGTRDAFGYHLKLGEGEIVLLADSSLFINLMQDGADNAHLVANLGAWLSDGGRRPVHLAFGGTPIVGDWHDPSLADAPMAELINRAIEKLSVVSPDEISVRFFIALLLAAAVLYTLSVFPGGLGTTSEDALPRTVASVDGLAGQPGGPAAPEPRRGSFPEEPSR